MHWTSEIFSSLGVNFLDVGDLANFVLPSLLRKHILLSVLVILSVFGVLYIHKSSSMFTYHMFGGLVVSGMSFMSGQFSYFVAICMSKSPTKLNLP